MIIIFKNSNDNIFLKAQLKVSNFHFIEVDSLEQVNLEDINDDFVYIIKPNFSFMRKFYHDLNYIRNIEKNIILGYNNIEVEKTNNLFSKYKKYQDNKNLNSKSINFCKIHKSILKKIIQENNRDINKLLLWINFDGISNYNYSTFIEIKNNIILNTNDIFLSGFRNLINLNNIDDVYKNYLKFKNDNIIENYEKQVKILFNQLNNEKLTCFIVYDNHEEIIDFLKKSPFNHKRNYLYLIKQKEINLDDLKFNIKLLDSNIVNLFDNIQLNYNCIFLNNLNNIKKILYWNATFIVDGKTDFSVKKCSIVILKFLVFNTNNFVNYLKEVGKYVANYFKDDLLILDQIHIQNAYSNCDISFRKELIDTLISKEYYDDAVLLMNFVIKNRLYFDNSYIFKIFSHISKINYYINIKDLKPLLNFLDLKTVDDFFNICSIFKYHNFYQLGIETINKFFEEDNENLNESEVIKVIDTLYSFEILKKEINISDDKKYLNFLLNYIDFINIPDNLKEKEPIYVCVLLFLNTRFELIDSVENKQKIIEKINSFLGIDLSQLYKENQDKVLENFKKFPVLIWEATQSLSDFMLSTKDILSKRKNIQHLSKLLLDNWSEIEDCLKSLIKQNKYLVVSNFKYSYHGLSNYNLFKNIIEIEKRFMILQSNKILERNIFNFEEKKTSKKKIGFISNFLIRSHSVFKDRHQVIKYLSEKEDFEVFLITFDKIQYDKETIFKKTKKIILGNNNLESTIKIIRNLNLDKLVFCEIGMDPKVKKLAHFRLANKQYNTWGHSDTSGYEEIDYFVSSELYELPYEESQKHYTEKLILQKGMCTCYVNPSSKYKLKLKRSFYGLSNYEKIILCPQSLFKIHPDFDLYIFEILLKNPDASIVLLHNERKTKMYERWDKVIEENKQYYGVLSRVKFVGGQNHKNFCNLMKCSDILIDPYPFGGCNSSLESLSLFKPLVTQPSIRINGRFTYGFYNKMNMKDMIAASREEYVNITTKLLNDKEFYDKQVNLLKERVDILFEDQETLKEWEELMSE